jgi:opacity protein-like surface antigen
MKKVIMSALATIVLAGSLQAQSLKLGVKLGANLSKIDAAAYTDGFKLSYQGGAWLELDVTKKLGVQPELLFSQTSSTTTNDPNTILTGLNKNIDTKLNYLSIPVLLRYNVNKFVTINLGPQYSILLNKNSSLLDNGKNAFKSGDLSAVAGLQLSLGSLRVYGRYNVGLTDLKNVEDKEKWTSQQIQLGVGLQL